MENRARTQGPVDNRYAVSPATVSGAEGSGFTERSSHVQPYAGFWRRTGAYLIDYILVIVAASLLVRLVAPVLRGFAPLLMIAGVWLYYALMESSGMQATLGKRAVGIKVTDLDGNRISFGRATGRLAGHLVSGFTLGIGFAMAVFTSHRQTLHDKMAGTLVVGKEWTEEEVVEAGAAPSAPAWQVVLVVLAVIFFGPFGIGIVAAIAIPAYQSYTIRAQIADGLRQAEPYKAEVAAAVAQGRSPADITLTGSALDGPKSKFVASIRVVNGAVAIDYGRSANRLIAGKELVLVPSLNERHELVWACGLEGISNNYLPPACRAHVSSQ